MSYINWAGVSSDTLTNILKVERYPDLDRPQRKIDVFSVPGRNGDLILPQDAWENYSQAYSIFSGDGSRGSSPDAFVEIAAWLYSPKGYQRLIDSYEPDYYRLAYYQGGLDVANSLSRYGQATIEFNCRPERFLLAGETETVYTPHYSLSEYITLTNPTKFASKPILRVVSDGASAGDSYCWLHIWPNGASQYGADAFVIRFEPTFAGTMYIDTQSLNCYDAQGNNLNHYVGFLNGTQTTYSFPELAPGETHITAYYGDENNPNTMISEVGITPNWWTL